MSVASKDHDEERIRLRQFELSSDSKPDSKTLTEIDVKIDQIVRVQRRRVTSEERHFIWKSLSGVCYLCQQYLPRGSAWHIEHVLAFSSNPADNDVLGNMLPACQGCNQAKGKKELKGIADDFTFNVATRAKDVSHLHTAARNAIIAALDVKHKRSERSLSDDVVKDAVDSTILLIQRRLREESETDVTSLPFALESIRMEQLSGFVAEPFANGSFGEVFSAIYKETETSEPVDVALKIPRFAAKTEAYESFWREVDSLSRLGRHKHIVSFIGYMAQLTLPGDADSSLALVLEHCPYALNSQRSLRNVEGVVIIAQVLSAVSHIHSLGIIHRDIKPANILIVKHINQEWKDASARLCDFGSAKLIAFENQKHTCKVGAGGFRPQEASQGAYSSKTDVFSIGKTMQTLKTENLSLQKQEIMGTWNYLIAKMTASQADDRPSFTDARDMYEKLFSSPSLGYNFSDLRDECTIISRVPDAAEAELSTAFEKLEVAALLSSDQDTFPSKAESLKDYQAAEEGKHNDQVSAQSLLGADSVIKSDLQEASLCEIAVTTSDITELEVYLASTARCLENIKGKTKMKYHVRQNCYYIKDWHCVFLSEAENFKHSKCKDCS